MASRAGPRAGARARRGARAPAAALAAACLLAALLAARGAPAPAPAPAATPALDSALGALRAAQAAAQRVAERVAGLVLSSDEYIAQGLKDLSNIVARRGRGLLQQPAEQAEQAEPRAPLGCAAAVRDGRLDVAVAVDAGLPQLFFVDVNVTNTLPDRAVRIDRLDVPIPFSQRVVGARGEWVANPEANFLVYCDSPQFESSQFAVTEATACGNLDLTMTPGYLHVVVTDLLCAPAPARGPGRGWPPSSGR